jgi:hypothetical protein
MIPPLHQEVAQMRYAEMRRAAAVRRLAGQAPGDGARPSIRLPRRDFLFLRMLFAPFCAWLGTGAGSVSDTVNGS